MGYTRNANESKEGHQLDSNLLTVIIATSSGFSNMRYVHPKSLAHQRHLSVHPNTIGRVISLYILTLLAVISQYILILLAVISQYILILLAE